MGSVAVCQARGCADAAVTREYCPRHYQQVRRHGRLAPERERIYGARGSAASPLRTGAASARFSGRGRPTSTFPLARPGVPVGGPVGGGPVAREG